MGPTYGNRAFISALGCIRSTTRRTGTRVKQSHWEISPAPEAFLSLQSREPFLPASPCGPEDDWTGYGAAAASLACVAAVRERW
jgi:hypothetical protein